MKPINTLLLLVGGLPLSADAFVAPQAKPTTNVHTAQSTLLRAKKTGKSSSKKQPAAGGGFGAATETKKKSVGSSNDYAIFPALEPDVKTTLVASDQESVPAELPNEMYQRLAQIYGLSTFNYEAGSMDAEKEESSDGGGGMMSMEDLISGNMEEEEEVEDSSTNNFQISELPPFEKIQVLHVDPLVLSVDNFFTPEESDAYVAMPSTDKSMFQTGSMTVGKDDKSKSQRTSTTWFNNYKNVPALMAKASRLMGIEGIDRWEEPQTVRYQRNEKFTWHLDALGPEELESTGGGQRVATLLVYHTNLDEEDGGATVFRDLKDKNGDRLKVRPKKGSALVFFPSAGGIPNTPLDIRTLHCGELVSETCDHDKWISQLWLREKSNAYKPTAPKGNTHADATDAIAKYCTST